MAEAPEVVKELVKKFERNIKAYKNPEYKEEQLKQEFLNPLFKALGWDVDNTSNAAPQYRDVIFEDSIKVAGGTKAPDYCFTLSGRRMFFVEAKKPSINLKDGIKPAYQLRRYAWSAKLPLSILTDFEEFAVYESRTRPKKTDKTSTGRIMYLTYKDFVEKWDEIHSIFSYEAVRNGSFDNYAEGTKKKKGTQEVDAVFLSEIENWRELFAKNIALRNKELSVEELNYSVQQIIDRIIFLRMGEDRGLEKYGKLLQLLSNDDIYEGFCEMCKDADAKYNSGLFYFNEEKGRNTTPDKLTLNLNIDNGVLRTIIKNLYYPDSPYEFSVLSPEILGNVYEQFLGKVIRLTPSHMAKIEEKPEVKKAGGVFYTPQFIVDYIVENTVGKLCNGLTPNKVAELKILDPACGSGSFLLGAYTYLLRWHLDYYSNLKDKKRLQDKIYKGKDDEWHLTIQEKKEILRNNIYGVDIDQQAVEVTKLSLLLKVLEGESRDVIEAQQKLFKERALPDLENNIKCGNSLIESDFYDDSNLNLTGDETKRVNTFDWDLEFAEIMNNGRFDAVIGNPPYIRIQAMKEWAALEVEHYKQKFVSAKGNYDIYVVFVEKGLDLLNDSGLLGFILPHKFFNAKYGQPLRSLLAEGKFLDTIVHFGDEQVFERATTYTNLLFLNKTGNKSFKFVKVDDLDQWCTSGECIEGKISLDKVTSDEWNFIVGEAAELFDKLDKMPVKLKDITNKIFQGLITGSDGVFLLENGENGKYYSKATENEHELENELLHPLCKGAINIRRYNVSKLTKSILFPYEFIDGKATLIPKDVFAKKYPKIWEYLTTNRNKLESRERGKWKNKRWYAFSRTQNMNEMEQMKILTPSIASEASFTLDMNDFYYFVGSGGGGGGGYGITLNNDKITDYKYIIGLLNSNLLDAYLKSYSSQFRGGYYAYNKQYIEKLPIRIIDFSNAKDVALHDKMVSLVEQMLQLNKDLVNANIPSDVKMIQRQIDATDKQIDNLVYELYGLTDDEIKIIEGS
ncbi:Eco57I restriction-modification methylase domain-containing protein [Methanobacterium oryzae]|uniref:Eco57I restriction-modification methylase domain-containing protein n=1 Tax=Methanobacterium oryzae TaxID=69540 RepID=UPI003D235400